MKEICHANGALFILDEIITGFRLSLGGAQKFFDIDPDLTTFGKAMANGFALAAVAGKTEFMNVGGIDEPGKERTFLMSSTHGAEMVSLGAFLQVAHHYEKHNASELLWRIARKWKSLFDGQIEAFGLQEYIGVVGTPLNMNVVCRDNAGAISLEFKTLLQQELVRNGVLMPWIAFSTSHGKKELDFFEKALSNALGVYSEALAAGISGILKGESIKPVFRKFN
jgi:glutamate-1-semialdehyde 2,1-aminomutase